MSEVNIDHWINVERPGYLRRDAILSGKELRKAIELKLRRWDGQSLELVHTSPDPIRQQVKAEVPGHLGRELADAELAVESVIELKDVAAKRFSDAEDVLRKFWNSNGPQLSERGREKYAELKAKMETAEKDFQDAHGVLEEAISQRVRAVNAVDAWTRTELITRREAARLEEEAAQAKAPATLAEKLHGLAQKLTT